MEISNRSFCVFCSSKRLAAKRKLDEIKRTVKHERLKEIKGMRYNNSKKGKDEILHFKEIIQQGHMCLFIVGFIKKLLLFLISRDTSLEKIIVEAVNVNIWCIYASPVIKRF